MAADGRAMRGSENTMRGNEKHAERQWKTRWKPMKNTMEGSENTMRGSEKHAERQENTMEGNETHDEAVKNTMEGSENTMRGSEKHDERQCKHDEWPAWAGDPPVCT